jgi:anti-anti-sigma factor
MDNKLEIRKDSPGAEQRIFLEGRLDANGALHLEDYLNGLVREGSYRIVLNMAGVHYLSSAGIRILVDQYKKLKKIGGLFILEALSDSVLEVLKMVGLVNMLTERSSEAISKQKQESVSVIIGSYRFDNETLFNGTMKITLNGNPGLSLNSGFTSADNHKIKFSADHYGIGIGAIGDGYNDCRNRYGEFIALGEAIIYKPSDGSKVPDYAIKKGTYEPEINALVSIQAKGSFSNRISFEPAELTQFISLENLTGGIAKTTGYKEFVFLLIAESTGIIGMSLNSSPVDNNQLFEFPGIREKINFTTEPAYSRMLTVSLGFYSISPDEKMKSFLRPVNSGSAGYIHTHTAVFPYQSLSRSETYTGNLILHLLESSIVQDVLHLINDTREIAGLGDTTFKQGSAWIGKVS